MDKFLYFRTVADVDNDDGVCGSATQLSSVCIPAKNIMAMAPASDTTLIIRYKPMKNVGGLGASGEEVLTDTITLTVNAHTHKNVVDALVAAINSNKLYNDGFIDVVDTVTTNLANATIPAIFFHGDITGVSGYTDDTNATGLAVAAAL